MNSLPNLQIPAFIAFIALVLETLGTLPLSTSNSLRLAAFSACAWGGYINEQHAHWQPMLLYSISAVTIGASFFAQQLRGSIAEKLALNLVPLALLSLTSLPTLNSYDEAFLFSRTTTLPVISLLLGALLVFIVSGFRYPQSPVFWIATLLLSPVSGFCVKLFVQSNFLYRYSPNLMGIAAFILIFLISLVLRNKHKLAWQNQYLQEEPTAPNYQKIREEYFSDPAADSHNPAHEVLGVSETATEQQIRDAYLKQIKLYHPDKVAALGPELKKLAEKKSKDITLAYQTLLSKRKGVF